MMGLTVSKNTSIFSLITPLIKERYFMGKHCKYCRCPKAPATNLHPCQHCGSMCKKNNKIVIFCSLECRLLGTSEKMGDCLIWKGALARDGYGKLMAFGKRDQRVHRVSYMAFKGEIPANSIIRHSCDVKECINPDHLLAGTVQENSDDFGARQGHPKGEDMKTSKLKEHQIEKIRDLYNQGSSQQKIADEFGVSQHLISLVVRNKIWRHV